MAERQVNFQERNANGENIFHLACRNYSSDMLASLLLAYRQQGEEEDGLADLLNATDNFGYAPLHVACMNDNEAAVVELLNRDASPGQRERQCHCSPLDLACRDGRLAIVQEFIRRGADLEAVGPNGWSALCWASVCGQTLVIRALATHGASADGAETRDGWAPLQLATRSGHIEAVRELLDSGADVNRRTRQGTALEVACYGNRVDILQELLYRGAQCDWMSLVDRFFDQSEVVDVLEEFGRSNGAPNPVIK